MGRVAYAGRVEINGTGEGNVMGKGRGREGDGKGVKGREGCRKGG